MEKEQERRDENGNEVPRIKLPKHPSLHAFLQERYSYLRDIPYKIEGPFIDEAELIGVLSEGEHHLFLAGYEKEPVRRGSSHEFPFLSPAENTGLHTYRDLRPLLPWPQPVIGVSWNPEKGSGRVVSGPTRANVIMQPVGQAQVWYGNEVGVLWEAYLHHGYDPLLPHLWEQVEKFLASQGVSKMYTLAHDPEYEQEFYTAFLTARGYTPLSDKHAMVKGVGGEG
jgi:hypothetical protein